MIVTPQRAFASLALIFGLIMVLITPPLQVPDEHKHFLRSYHISEGKILAERRYLSGEHVHYATSFQSSEDQAPPPNWHPQVGALLPRSLWLIREQLKKDQISFRPEEKQQTSDIFLASKTPLNSNDRIFLFLKSSAFFSPVPYVPQVFGILLGRILGLNPLILLYLARLSNLICWIVLVYFAIRISPVFKWVLLLLALMPMSLFLAASASADCMTNALAFLLIAAILRLALDSKERTTNDQILDIFLLSLALSLCKQGYAPILLLTLLVPAERFGSIKRKVRVLLLLALSVAAAVGLWSLCVKSIYVPRDWADPQGQLMFILGNPLEYMNVIWRTFASPFISISYIGVLGFLDTLLPVWIYLSYYAVSVTASLWDNRPDITISLKQKALLGATFLLITGIVLTMTYLHWTPLEEPKVSGMQGRYFIPIGMLFFLIFYNRKIGSGSRRFSLLIPLYSIVVLSTTCHALLTRYY